MDSVTYAMLRDHPELLDVINAQARRERALAAHRYLIAPVKALFRAGRATAEPRGLQHHCA